MPVEDPPQIGMFYCANCLVRDEAVRYCKQLGVDGRMAISLPCSGKVNIPYLVKAFETGADGVVVLTCEIDACRHLEGNKRAKRRVQAVDSLLDEIGMGRGRIAVLEVKEGGHERTMALLREFSEKVREMLAAEAAGVGK
jgi:coenzyme F420-reducing hydrogenase delta subunit